MSFLPTGKLAPFVPNMPVPANVQPKTPFRLRDIPGKMWSGLQAAQADWKKKQELDMKLKEGMLARILGQPQVDPMAQQKAGLDPAQFQLAAPAPIQRPSLMGGMNQAGPGQVEAPTIHSFRGAGSVLPSGNGPVPDQQFFRPMY